MYILYIYATVIRLNRTHTYAHTHNNKLLKREHVFERRIWGRPGRRRRRRYIENTGY